MTRFTTILVTAVALGAITPPSAGQPGRVLGPAEPPLSLTASDGTGLTLEAMSAEVVVEAPLAFTELRLTFRNPEDRVREGRFRITLPSGAAISRFAMKIDGRWQEGEVVELQAAREAYEDFLHRRQDPALLETEAGNEFSARVFPIPPRATKELIVSYSQELVRSDDVYRLPLRGLPRLGSLEIRALVARVDGGAAPSSLGGRRARHEVIEVRRQSFAPDRDFEVPLVPDGRLGLRHDNLVVARVRPLHETLPPEPIRSLTVLFDTSASRALGFGDQIDRVRAVLAQLPPELPVSLAAFDQGVELVARAPARDVIAGAERWLRERRALGASDLSAALAWVARQQAVGRLLLVTDGVATTGDLGNDKLREAVRRLGAGGVERVDVLAVGGIRDDERLARLVTALPRAGVVLDGTRAPAEIARRLALATRSGLSVTVDGASWIWPQRLDGVQPGDEVLVYADLPPGRSLSIKVGERVVTGAGALVTVERPLLERAWVKARISRLLAQRDTASDRDLAEGLQRQVIALSTKHRVLTPYTALLVLETEADYARFGIERRALADILTIGPRGMTVLERKDADFAAEDAVARGGPEKGADKAANVTANRRAKKAFDIEMDGFAVEPAQSEVSAARAPRVATAGAAPAPGGGVERKAEEGRRSSRAAAEPSPPVPAAPARDEAEAAVVRESPRRRAMAPAAAKPASVPPYEGKLLDVMSLVGRRDAKAALAAAFAWRDGDAGDVLALVALGEAAEAAGDRALAARAYGSIIDLHPGRADLRRFAGQRLERVQSKDALALAIDTFRRAVEQRPDHPASHRLLAFALVKAGRPHEAFDALAAGVGRRYPGGRFAGVDRVLREDLGLVAAAWRRAEPARANEITARTRKFGAQVEDGPSLRFVLNWETDANDVDFHIRDGRGGHAFFSQPRLPSGGELYADVTTGYGPECFTVRGAARAYPYELQAHYYRKGPMGYGMGKLQIIDHDGRGGLRFEERPFVVMRDGAYVNLGRVGR